MNLNETNKEFVIEYENETASLADKLGDTTYETNGGNKDYAQFINSERPFFTLGGSNDIMMLQ